MAVQPGLCQTWSETPKTGFLTTRLILSIYFILICSGKLTIVHSTCVLIVINVLTELYFENIAFTMFINIAFTMNIMFFLILERLSLHNHVIYFVMGKRVIIVLGCLFVSIIIRFPRVNRRNKVHI